MTTALVYDPIFREHLVPPDHPERPQRVAMVMEYLKTLNWLERDGLVQLTPRAATLDELAAIHERSLHSRSRSHQQRSSRARREGHLADWNRYLRLSKKL